MTVSSFTFCFGKSLFLFDADVSFVRQQKRNSVANDIFIYVLYFVPRSFPRYLEDLAMMTGYMGEIKSIEGLIVAAETLGGETIFFSLSGKKSNIFAL